MEIATVCYLALSESITHSPFRLLTGYFSLISGTFMVIFSMQRTLSISCLPSRRNPVFMKLNTEHQLTSIGHLRIFFCIYYHDI